MSEKTSPEISDIENTRRELDTAKSILEDLVSTQPGWAYRFRIKANHPFLSDGRPNAVVDFISERFAEITGYTREELEADPLLTMKMIHPEEYEKFVEENNKANITLTRFVWEGRMIFRGQTRRVRFESIPRLAENGDKVWTGFLSDITDRKKVEEALRQSEEKYRELANTVPVGIYECAIDGKLTFANTVLYNWFGYTEDTLNKGVNVSEFVHPKDRERVRTNLARLFADPQPIPNEYTAVRKDGTMFQILSISTLARHEGKPVGFRGIHFDQTEKKKLEAVLQNTARLESLGILAGGIAHDFNNLLTGIFGFIDLASNESKDARVSRYLASAMGTIGRARGLTQQLLTFSKGGAPVKKVGPLFPFIQETAQFALSGAAVSCTFDVSNDLWSSEFDKNQIGQVIDNIMINAKQAMPMGGTIEVIARNVVIEEKQNAALEKGRYVLISVKDHGIGIPKEMLPRIFDPFFTTKTEGHGLGLATTYSIVKRHGGTIDAESSPGTGSTFHLYLPAASAEAVVSEKTAMPAMVRKTGTILVVDDDEVIRTAVGAMLRGLGYSVVLKKEGKEAVVYFQEVKKAGNKIAGIFLDLTVPGGMGGKETVLHLRAFDAKIPIFVASGYSEDPVMARPGDYGFTASICKPFSIGELAEMMDKHIVN